MMQLVMSTVLTSPYDAVNDWGAPEEISSTSSPPEGIASAAPLM